MLGDLRIEEESRKEKFFQRNILPDLVDIRNSDLTSEALREKEQEFLNWFQFKLNKDDGIESLGITNPFLKAEE